MGWASYSKEYDSRKIFSTFKWYSAIFRESKKIQRPYKSSDLFVYCDEKNIESKP